MKLFYHSRQRHKILIFELFPYNIRISRILFVIGVFPVPVEPGIETFIIPTPKSYTTVIAQASYIINSFPADIFQQFTLGRKYATRKHKVLPN